MALAESASVWTTKGPAAWPDTPSEMTFTTLVEIESCPRRWALGAADYPDLWAGRGYPPRVQMNALPGTVVHSALEEITKALVRAGCPSVQDASAPQVIKNLGGYTKVVNDCIDRLLERLASSPRAKRAFEASAHSLRAKIPELRTRIQTMLCRMRLPQVAVSPQRGGPRLSGPLTLGVFPEIEVHAKQIRWKGKIDLLALSPTSCVITDFKTGVPNERHAFQVKVYALLWNRDSELNPDGRRADRLVLTYSNGDVEIPAPSDSELDALENEIAGRSKTACQAVSQRPPAARPTPDNCRYCGVRQLCEEYWTSETQGRMSNQLGEQRFTDLEVTITGRHGPTSWDAKIELSRHGSKGKLAVVRTTGDSEFRTGDRLRIVDAMISTNEDEVQPLVVTVGTLSEVYAVR